MKPVGARNASFPIVGIGASAGGLEAFTSLLKHLPLDTGMAFVLVQHLDPQHESALTQLLSRATKLPVHEVTQNLRVKPNHIYIIPPNTSLGITHGVLKLQPREQTRTPHRSVDLFFESLAQDQKERAIGVILSGAATDGTMGLEAIKAEGGITFAQDTTARYDSMPHSAVAAGCVDFVLSPPDIAQELARIAKHPVLLGHPPHSELEREADQHGGEDAPLASGGSGTPATGSVKARTEAKAASNKSTDNVDSGYKKILLLLRTHSGVDFALYKSSTIRRRINRRMILNKLDTPESYAGFLRGNSKELDALYSDVLISVTSFFRNPEAFDVLQRKVFPKLLARRGDEPLRVWTLGCSTGQEAYSIAMAFTECADQVPSPRKLQLFATDLNDTLLEKARHGLYTKSLAQDISPERLRRFFVEEEGGYRIIKSLRESVVFARQNLIGDPPFSRMDLISCRNLMIYLEPALQKKALPTFHYALKPEGFLFLGASESISGFTELFEPLDKKQKIYSKKSAATPVHYLPVRNTRSEVPEMTKKKTPPPLPLVRRPLPEAPDGFRSELSAQREADRVTVNQFAPPGVLINAELQILQFRGTTAPYLESPSGKASFDVLKMARDGLMLPLRTAINKAKKDDKTVRKENVRIGRNGQDHAVNIEVIPLKNLHERCYLVLFEEAVIAGRKAGVVSRVTKTVITRSGANEQSRRITELESVLNETRDYLQSMQEQYEAANEELQASSEEVQSANEELQSVNEELETSKEELESANEELITVNEEMAGRNTELNRLNSDLINLQNSTQLSIILVGRDLTVRRFSAQAEKQFKLAASDLGRPIGNLRLNLDLSDLENFITEVITDVREHEREVRDNQGRWHSLRVRPYLTLDNKVEGAVLVVMNIDGIKRSEQTIIAARNHAEAIIKTVRDPLVILQADLRVQSANEAFYRDFQLVPERTIGHLIYDLGNRQWDIPKLRELLEDILKRNNVFNDFKITHDFGAIGIRTMLLNARCLKDVLGGPDEILLGIEDITERKRADAATTALAAIVDSSDDAIISKDLNGIIKSWNKGAERLFGYTASEIIGQPVTLLIPPDRLHEETHILARLKLGESVEPFETVRMRKGGLPLEISLAVSPIKDAQGWVTGASKIARDISARKMTDEQILRGRELVDRIIDRSPFGLYIIDSQFRIAQVNNAAKSGAFKNVHPIIGRDFSEAMHILWPEAVAAEVIATFRYTLDTGESYFSKDFLNPRNDIDAVEGYEWELHRITLLDGQFGVACYYFDSTRLRLTEEALRKSEASLKEADARKSEFLAVLAHELRNPLAPIGYTLEILKRADGKDELIRPAFATMERQLAQMVRLVDDLLDVSRITRGKLNLRLQELELASVIHQAVEATRPLLEAARHEFKVTMPLEPLYLYADAARLAQVIGNLLTNACKFTAPGGHILLTVERHEDDAVVTVKDSGIGVPPSMLPKIFEMFTQGDKTLERVHGGLGIGLALVQNLVQMHGGSVQAFSQGLGQGSEFVLRLPGLIDPTAASLAPQPLDSAVVEPVAVKGRCILVVDDNHGSANAMAMLLKLSGYETHTAYDGAEAVEAAERLKPSVVLLDLGLPKLNGYEAARQIREQAWGKGMVLLALTGWGQDEDRKKTAAAGFDAHLVKPVRYAELTQLLAQLLKDAGSGG